MFLVAVVTTIIKIEVLWHVSVHNSSGVSSLFYYRGAKSISKSVGKEKSLLIPVLMPL